MDFKLDMSMMLAMHDALRRELVQVGRIAGRRDDNPGTLLRAALGWELFKKFLLAHHQSEDDALWPPLRAAVSERADRVALIDASLTEEQWQHFAQVQTERLRGDAQLYMPWLLNGASPEKLGVILSKFPPPLLAAYREQWQPRYATLTIWPAAGKPAR